MTKKIVVPGELIADKPMRLENAFVQSGKTYSKVLGIYDDDARSSHWRARGSRTSAILSSASHIEAKGSVCIVDLSSFVRGLISAPASTRCPRDRRRDKRSNKGRREQKNCQYSKGLASCTMAY